MQGRRGSLARAWSHDATRRYAGHVMSTRKLILAALLCGLAILVAATVQLMQIS